VLSAYQGGGEPLRPMPLEITRCLHAPGAELTPPPPPVRRGPGHVMAVDTPWPNGQVCHSCGRRPDNGLDPMVTMVPVRGGRAAPPVKAPISINPTADAFASVWATAAVGGTAATRAPARSAVGASALVRAAATVPLGVHGCPLRCLLPRCLPRQLELVVSVVVGRNRAAGATGAQSLEFCCRRTRCIRRRRRCFYFCPSCQFRHRQPCRPCRRRCSLCRRSLAFLCRGNLGLLPVLCAQGDRALRLSFEHGALVGGCYVGRGCLR
jgi:hypothetical protein